MNLIGINKIPTFPLFSHSSTETIKNVGKCKNNKCWNISISREISKKFEEIYRATISEVMNMLTEIKGEFVIVVEGNKDVVSFDDITIKEHVNMYMEDGLTEKEAIKKVAKERNMSKSDIYKEVKINN